LAVLASMLVYAGWGPLTKNKTRFRAGLLTVFSFIAAIIYLYMSLSQFGVSAYLNRMVYDYTGETMVSGRGVLWASLVDVIRERWLVGHGAGALPKDFLAVSLSAHNFYLQTALQVGLMGLLPFLALVWSIWEVLWHGRHAPVVRLSGTFMVGVLVEQTFEVYLTQTNVAIGVAQWVIIAVGVSNVLDVPEKPSEDSVHSSRHSHAAA